MAADSILTTVRQFLNVDPTVQISLEPIQRGASGRTIVRVKCEVRDPFIGVYWTDERPDNDQFPAVAGFLRKSGLNVAEVFYSNLKWRVALLEDLGDTDLLSLKDEPFETREPYYRSALQQLDKLLYTRGAKDQEFNPDFDPELYRWEQEYFFEHFVEGILGMDADELRQAPEFQQLADRLGKSARHLVHRDFQSQNLMLKDGKAWWIDFQGMRRGHQEYDLASLVFDPYMDHSAEEREKILDLWEDIAEERPIPQLFHECAAQRLMQALGAYGKILADGGDEWYRAQIPAAVRFLTEVTADTPLAPLLAPALQKAGA